MPFSSICALHRRIDSLGSAAPLRYQSTGSVRWTVKSSSATQLARLRIRSPQRSAPRHQAAFRAAPEPRSGTSWLWRSGGSGRMPSGAVGMRGEAGRRRTRTSLLLHAPVQRPGAAAKGATSRRRCQASGWVRFPFLFGCLLIGPRCGQVRRLLRGGGRGRAARRRAGHAGRVLLAAPRVVPEDGAERLDLRPGRWPR